MTAFLKKILFGLAVAGGVMSANAFSLNGPPTPWQTARLGYNVNNTTIGGGVLNLGEEYRWNVPKIYYSFTSDFHNYFGQRGVDEIVKAFQLLNELPEASQMNLDDYPLRSSRINHRAQALGLTDLRSYTLTMLLNSMGLQAPSRFVYTLRSRWNPPNDTNYFVVKRNFDPVTLSHSSYVNGRLWTYSDVIDETVPGSSLAFTVPVDPLDLAGITYSPVADHYSGNVYGLYWTVLTRDDIGGLKYIYRNINRNVENAPPIATGGTHVPWGSPFPAPLVDPALRGGVEKIEFIKVEYDSIVGGFMTPFTNNYTETIYVNGRPILQSVARPISSPNIIFDAADITGGDGADSYIITETTDAWDNNADINDSVVTLNDGPGVATALDAAPSVTITFNTVGPLFLNSFPDSLDEESAIQVFSLWGSFDGTTNDPVIYPNNVSIDELEFLLLQAQ